MINKLYFLFSVFVFLFLFGAHAVYAGGGGGGCTPSDNINSPTSLSAGTTYGFNNTGCDAQVECEFAALAYCPSCACTFDECYYDLMGAMCSVYSCICGSVENTSYAEFCPSTTGTYTFDLSSISCSGGGASLQWGIQVTGTSCQTGFDIYCTNGTTGETVNEALTAGTCYTLFFDGNAGAACTWTFLITPPVACTDPTTSAGGDKDICAGGAGITLDGSSTGGSGSTLTYSWSPTTNLSCSNCATPTATPTSSTTYTLTTCWDACCTSDEVLVTVNPIPTANAGADQTICSGGCATIGNDPVGAEDNTYAWDNGAGSGTIDLTGGGQDHGTKSVCPLTTTTYKLTITDGSGSGCMGFDAVTITVGSGGSATWNGTNSNWADPVNWSSCLVPTCGDDVVIASTSNDPIINAAANCNNLTINSGAELTINTGNTISICGDYTNNGSLSAAVGSTIEFTGTGVQNMNGSLSGANKFPHLLMNKTSATLLEVNAALDIDGDLTGNTGRMDSNSNTITATGDFLIIETDGFVYGSGTVELNGSGSQNLRIE